MLIWGGYIPEPGHTYVTPVSRCKLSSKTPTKLRYILACDPNLEPCTCPHIPMCIYIYPNKIPKRVQKKAKTTHPDAVQLLSAQTTFGGCTARSNLPLPGAHAGQEIGVLRGHLGCLPVVFQGLLKYGYTRGIQGVQGLVVVFNAPLTPPPKRNDPCQPSGMPFFGGLGFWV